MFIAREGGAQIQELVKLSVQAHSKAGYMVKSTISTDDCFWMIFENGDKILVYQEGAQIERLTPQEINNTVQRLFFDNKLPDSAIRASIEALGLTDYMIKIGLCSDKLGGK